MADTSFATNAAAGGASFAADADGSGFEYPYVKLTFGASGTQTRVSTAAGLPVQQQSGATFTVVGAAADGAAVAGNPVLVAGFDGTNAQSLSTTAGGLLQIHDGAGSITVDNAGTFAVQAAATEADGANVTLGAKADAKSTATDTTAVTAMSVWKQISASVQAPPSQAVTNAGTFAVQAMPAVAASWTLTNVNDAAISTSLLGANANRKGATFYNDSTESLYLKFGTTASATSFTVKILPGGYYEIPAPIYVGAIDGIWSADASGAVRMSEAA